MVPLISKTLHLIVPTSHIMVYPYMGSVPRFGLHKLVPNLIAHLLLNI
jgi:hypothetical protein